MITEQSLTKSWEKIGQYEPVHSHLTFHKNGLTLGAGTVIVPSGRDEWGRPVLKIDGNEERILALLSVAHDQPVMPRILDNLRSASRCWCKGEITLAYIHIAFSGLQALEDEEAPRRLFMAKRLLDHGMDETEMLKGLDLLPQCFTPWSWQQLVKEFNPDQPRVPAGCSEGGQFCSSKAEGDMPPSPYGSAPDTPRINSEMPPPALKPNPSGGPNEPRETVSVEGLPAMASPVPDPTIRGVDTPNDQFGGGGFGVSRDGGSRAHGGVDLLADPGETVTSPVTGTVVATFDPYRRDPRKKNNYWAVSILTDDGHIVRVLYINSPLEVGNHVIAGQTKIGTAQNLGTLYKGIQNHIHLDIKKANPKIKGGTVGDYLDPTPLVRKWQRD